MCTKQFRQKHNDCYRGWEFESLNANAVSPLLVGIFIYLFWNKFCWFIFSSQKILWPHSVTDCNSKQKDLPPIIGKSANMFSNFFLKFLVKRFFGEKKVAIGSVLYMYAYNTSQLKKRQPGGVRGGWQRPS